MHAPFALALRALVVHSRLRKGFRGRLGRALYTARIGKVICVEKARVTVTGARAFEQVQAQVVIQLVFYVGGGRWGWGLLGT